MAETLPPVVALLTLDARDFQESLGGVLDSVDDAKATLDRQGEEMAGVFDPLDENARRAAEQVGESFGVIGDDGERSAVRVDESFKAALDSIRDSVAKVAVETGGMSDALGDALGGGVQKGADDLKAAERDAEDESGGFSERVAGMFKRIGGALGNLGVPFAETFTGMGEKIEGAEAKGDGFAQSLKSLAHVATAVTGVALAGVAGESLHLANEQQEAATSLAANANISVKAAADIGAAFESTAFKTIFTGTEMTKAFSGVAAQLATVQGHALNTAQALGVMTAAGDLAEGTGSDLTTATTALASVMQAYGLRAKDAASASDVLFNTSRDTGVGLSQITSTVDRLHTQLGNLTPSLGDVGALMVDLTQHGETGRAAISAVSTAFSTLLKSTSSTGTTVAEVRAAFDQLPASIQPIAKQLEDGKISSEDFTKAMQNASPAAATAGTAFAKMLSTLNVSSKTLGTLSTTAAENELSRLGVTVYTSSGRFKGMGDVIAQLAPKLRDMSEAQREAAVQSLFGATAGRRLLDVIMAGPDAWQRDTAAVSKAGSAHEAAEKQAQTLQHQLELLKAGLEDEGVRIGNFLIPILRELVADVAKVVDWFEKHKDAAIALAAVVGGALATAIGVTLVNMLTSMTEATIRAGGTVVGLGKRLLGMGDEADEGAETTGGAIEGLQDTFEQFSSVVSAAIDEITGALGGMGETAEASAATVEGALEGVGATGETLAAEAPEIGAALDTMMGPFGLAIMAVTALLPVLLQHWHAIWDGIKEVVGAVVDWLKQHWPLIVDILLGPVGIVFNFVREHFTEIKTITIGVFDDIIDWLKREWPLLIAILTGPVGVAVLEIHRNWSEITQFTENLWHDVTGFFAQLWGDVERIVVGGVDTVTGFFHRLTTDIMDGIDTFGHDMYDFFVVLPGQIVKAIGNGMYDVGRDMINDLVHGVEDMGSAIWDAIKRSVPGSGVIGHALSAIGLAEGGIVTKPTLAMVGEAGYPEAVIPLKNGANVRGFNDALAGLGVLKGAVNPVAVTVAPAVTSAGSGDGGGGPWTVEVNMQVDGQRFYSTTFNDLRSVLLKNKRAVVNLGLA